MNVPVKISCRPMLFFVLYLYISVIYYLYYSVLHHKPLNACEVVEVFAADPAEADSCIIS